MKERAEVKASADTRPHAKRPAAWIAMIVAGLVLEQVILIGPSLIGKKVLLPLDILALPGMYLPSTPGVPPTVPHNRVYSDLVQIETMSQQFAVSEFSPAAGRYGFPTIFAAVLSFIPSTRRSRFPCTVPPRRGFSRGRRSFWRYSPGWGRISSVAASCRWECGRQRSRRGVGR